MQDDRNVSASSGRTLARQRRPAFFPVGYAVVLGLGLAGVGISAWRVAAAARQSAASTPALETPTAGRHPVIIRRPAGPPMVPTGQTNFQGQPVFVSCSACHTTTSPNLQTQRAEDLTRFHQGLTYNHGALTCLSCHNAADYDTLRLADGRPLEFANSLTLCSQCHGPQRRDFDRGLHGGMTGYWDLTRGGRERNTCLNCHDPHAPAFPPVLPVLPPRDRVSVPKPPPTVYHP